MDTFYYQRREHREQRMDRNYEDDEEHDPDYLMALRLSAELNGPRGESSTNPPRDSKKKFSDMLGVFSRGNKAYDKSQAKRKSSAPLFTPSAASTSMSEQASGTVEKPTRLVNYELETSSASSSNLDNFAEFMHHIKTHPCSHCKQPFFASKVDALTRFQNWMDGMADKLSCIVRCKSCGISGCITCTPEPFSKLSWSKIQSTRQEVSWCCVSGRLFLIWSLLCGFDSYLSESRKADKTAKPPKPDPSSSSSSHSRGRTTRAYGSGIGYGGTRYPQSYLPKGTGYDSYGHDSIDYYDSDFESEIQDLIKAPGHTPAYWKKIPPAESKKETMPKAQKTQISEDRHGKVILSFLSDLFPSLERQTRFDQDPPAALLEMLMGSKILNYCAELLRNDSLADIVQRKDLYQNLFSFLNVLASSSAAGLALFSVRAVYPEPVDLVTLSFSDGVPGEKEVVPGLADCLRNLAAQSSLVLQNAAINPVGFANEEGQTMLRICRQVSDLAQFIRTNSRTHNNGKDKTVDSAAPEELRFTSVEEKQIFPTHKFASDAKKPATSKPGRFKRLITEITTLQTGLPPGIFVRYCETRPDILKCIIIGPVGTPYENGMFEFDIFCGSNFPAEPPSVSFKGTGGGKASINPNLYPDGKVCLSLLGTWSGERWSPKDSTLLQVLISIQAMILCEEPWYNEPGREADYNPLTAGSPSERYNRSVRFDTVRYALLYHWLEQTPELWTDVVTHHFTQHGNNILKKVEEWANEAAKAPQHPRRRNADFGDFWEFGENMLPPISHGRTATSNQAISSMLLRLQDELKKYGATYTIKYATPQPEALSPPQALSESVYSPSPYSPFSPPWAQHSALQPSPLSDYPDFPHEPGYYQAFYPSAFSLGTGQSAVGSGSPGVASGSQTSNSPPGPLIVGSSGPPSSNTRSAAARSQGSGVEASAHRGRGGLSYGPPIPTFGRGRGAAGSSIPIQGSSSYFVSETARGGHGGRGGWGRGRGRGRGDGGSQGAH